MMSVRRGCCGGGGEARVEREEGKREAGRKGRDREREGREGGREGERERERFSQLQNHIIIIIHMCTHTHDQIASLNKGSYNCNPHNSTQLQSVGWHNTKTRLC